MSKEVMINQLLSNQPNERRLLLTYKQADDSLANDMDSNSGDNITEREEAKEAVKPTDVGDLLVGSIPHIASSVY